MIASPFAKGRTRGISGAGGIFRAKPQVIRGWSGGKRLDTMGTWVRVNMIKRKPIEHGIFEDAETAKRYNKEVGGYMRLVSKSFISVARKWGITDGKVLDVGTGTGSIAIGFAQGLSGVQVVGLDLSDVALELARDNAQKSEISSRVTFEKGDAQDMPFEDTTFDLVISSDTLHLIKNPIKMFDEVHRVLKPQGWFFISDFRRSWLGILTKHIRASYSPKEVRDLLSQSKLQKWQVKDYFFWLSIFSKSRDRI
jgi:ubiquinone/menaquinone biosynthesis C-methylase UbiE